MYQPQIQRRSTTGVAKEKANNFMTEKVKGKEAKDRTVKKAVKSKGEFEPKQKHVRKAILDCWRENGANTFLRLLASEPIDEDAICGFKGMVLTHKVLQEGPSGCLRDCHRQVNMFVSLRNTWERKYRVEYSDALRSYLFFLINKIQLHHRHPDFSGSFSYEDFMKKNNNSRYDNPQEAMDVAMELMELQSQALEVKNEILKGLGTQILPAKLSALVPLVVESYNIYTLTVHFLKQLCDQVDSLDQINHLIEKFYSQYFNIRSFYDDCNNVSFVISLITVPVLPSEPPQFFITKVVKAPKKVEKKKREPPKEEPTLQEMNQMIQSQMPPQPDYSAQQAAYEQYQREQMMLQQQQQQMMMMQQQQQNWVTFDEQQAFPQQQQAQFNNADREADAFGFSKLEMEKVMESSPPQPEPEPEQPKETGPDPRDAQIKDLKRRLLGLQKLFKAEKEKRLAAEAGVQGKEAEIEKWKSAYETLLKKNESLNTEKYELEERADELEQQVAQAKEELQAERGRRIQNELMEVARAIELSLVNLDNPTHTGRANASPDEVSDAISMLLQAISSLQSADDEASRLAALRSISSAVSNLLDIIKGVANLTEDPKIKQMLFNAGRQIAKRVAELLRAFRNDPEDKQEMENCRGKVEEDVLLLDEALRALLAEGEKEEDEVVDFDAFADEATRELMKAVKAIEDAAKRLENSRHEKKPPVDATQAGISEAIMDAALAIAGATANLVKHATTVQQENVAKGRAGKTNTFYKRDCVWIEGLISAARAVAASTSNLVQCASDAADGKVDEEMLIAASQEVSSATAQLVCSARVRSDPNSQSQGRLEEASKAVSQATHYLVEAARRARERKEEANDDVSKYLELTPMKKMLAVQEAKAQMLRLQHQLEQAQKHLSKLHSDEYQNSAPAAASGSDNAPALPPR